MMMVMMMNDEDDRERPGEAQHRAPPRSTACLEPQFLVPWPLAGCGPGSASKLGKLPLVRPQTLLYGSKRSSAWMCGAGKSTDFPYEVFIRPAAVVWVDQRSHKKTL